MLTELQPEAPRHPDERPFRCEVAREYDGVRIRAIGELDMASVPILKTELDAFRDAGVRRLVFDLSDLAFIDSSGLHCILEYEREARQDGFSIDLVPGPPAVQHIFELTHTRALLPFIDA